MELLELRDYCLSLPQTEETTPFDETTLVYKVAGKMFACMDMVQQDWVVVKVDPERKIELCDEYADITDAWHFNKKHWMSVGLTGDIPARLIRKFVCDSYLLVVGNMPRLKRQELSKAFIDFEREAGT